MKYVNINSGESISIETYKRLTPTAQANFTPDEDKPQVSHQIIEHRSNKMSMGDAVGLAIVTPLVILGELLG